VTAERIISGTAGVEEEAVENAIRPRRLQDYIEIGRAHV
jgi:Holliday junction resolvasome RuvABC ATP-dependent DNA helicase subunit